MDFTTNYCGMYWSDGKVQSSVANGKSKPVSKLDAACKEHDSSYATCPSRGCREAADIKFHKTVQKYGKRGKLYGALVLHGNRMVNWYSTKEQDKQKAWSRAADEKALEAKRADDRRKIAERERKAEEEWVVSANATTTSSNKPSSKSKPTMVSVNKETAPKEKQPEESLDFQHPRAGLPDEQIVYGAVPLHPDHYSFLMNRKNHKKIKPPKNNNRTKTSESKSKPKWSSLKAKRSPRSQQHPSRSATPSAAPKRR